eukprot:1157583-Pelagomonas_calceolata.AAC.3
MGPVYCCRAFASSCLSTACMHKCFTYTHMPLECMAYSTMMAVPLKHPIPMLAHNAVPGVQEAARAQVRFLASTASIHEGLPLRNTNRHMRRRKHASAEGASMCGHG